MALTPGATLGPYTIRDQIDAGGFQTLLRHRGLWDQRQGDV